MANYFLNDDGSLTKKNKKKKGNNYIIQDNGKITLNPSDIAPVKNPTTNTIALRDGYGTADEQGYTYTGRTYGDYWYQGYSQNKDKKIVSKDGKYYIDYGNGNYQDVDKLSFMTSKELSDKEYEEAKKAGFKGSKASLEKIKDKIKLDTAQLSESEYKEYESDLKRQQDKKDEELKRKSEVQYGGSGLKGAFGTLKTYASNVGNKIVDEIIAPIKNFDDNYETGKLNNQLALEYYKKMEGKKNNADELAKKVETYNSFNEDLINDPGAMGTAIQQLNTQVESIKNQGIAATLLTGGGALLGGLATKTPQGAWAGAKTGAALGYTFGSTPYMYKLEAGNQFKALTDMGVPDDIAKKYSRVTGGVNAAIESGENILDLFTFGAAGKTTSAVSKEAVGEMVEEYGESTVKHWLKNKLGEETADKVIKGVKVAGTSYMQNIGSEALEESLQETTSITTERLATNEADIDRKATLKDDLERVLESGVSAAISTALTGPLTSVAGSIVTSTVNSVSSKVKNKKTTSKEINNEIKEEIIKENPNITTQELQQIQSEVFNEIQKKGIVITDIQQEVQNIDNQIETLEKQLMATENDVEYEKISKQIRALEEKANKIEKQGEKTQKTTEKNQIALTKDEQYAVNKWSGANSYLINDTLRRNEPLPTEINGLNLEKVSNDLSLAIKKQPTVEDKVYRSIKLDGKELDNFLNKYKEGEVVQENAFTSASIGQIYDDSMNIQMEIESHTAKDTTELMRSDEQEVMFDKGSKFKILKVDASDKNNIKILAEDVTNKIDTNQAEKDITPVKTSDNSKDLKQKQLDVILKENPMTDDYHTGIRTIEDIKTFDETINDDESFVWGDFSREDAKKALEKGEVTVYSSYPIEQGVFVSTSKNQARDYAGGGKVYSKTVPLNEVAWINGDEGQYAKVEEIDSNTENNIAPIKEELSDLTKEIKNMMKDTKKEIKSLKKEIKEVKTDINEAVEDFKTMTEEELAGYEQQGAASIKNISGEDLDNMIAPMQQEPSQAEIDYFQDKISIDDKYAKLVSKNAQEVLGLNKKQAKGLEEVIKNNANSTKEQIYEELSNKYSELGIEHQLEDVKEIKKVLREAKIKVSEQIKDDITDYAYLKQKNFGKIRFSNEGMQVDQVYEELSETYPDFFPRDITNPTDQLLKMIDVANESTTLNETLVLPEETIQDTTDFIYESIQEYKSDIYTKSVNEATKVPIDESLMPTEETTEEIAPVVNASNTQVSESIAPFKESKVNDSGQGVFDLGIVKKLKAPEGEIKNKDVEPIDINKAKQITIDGTEENLVQKTKKELRKALLGTEARKEFIIGALDNAKNRSMALMNNTDTIRNTELVFGRDAGKVINEIIFQKEIDNEADSIAWQNKERQEIKDLGIKARSKESAAVQKYGEKQYVNEKDEVVPYGDSELAKEFPDVATQDKIKKAAKVLRGKYDTYIESANDIFIKLGFDPIPKRQDYMRHFQEINDVISRFGIPFNAKNMEEHTLPTDVNGLSEYWSPQKNYFANIKPRKGVKTTYDAITGIDGYIGGIANLIHHTEDIQRGRAFEELIRETFGEDKGFENLESLPEELQKARAEKIQDNHLSNYAAWVHEWTNNVAGKKSKIDRSVESLFGRKAFAVLDEVRKQVGANMIGFNLSSSLTNLIAPVQAASKTNKLAVLKGTADTIKNMFIKDNFMSKNKFLTSRMGTDMLSQNAWQKMQNAGFIFMKGMDWFSSNQIVRSKYYELRAKGMSEQQAHSEAGKFAARILGDRTKGANAQLYNSKLIGLVTQFQLEVNNQLYSQFYDTYHESKEAAKGNALKTAAGMTFTLGQLFAFTHLFGQTFEAIAGYNPTFDVIDMLKTAFGWGDEDDDEEKTTSERLKDAADQLVDALPYVNILTGGGRIPVLSGVPNLVGVATGGKDQYGNELTLEGELKKLLYLIPPAGGNQIKKTTQGLGMFDEDLPVSGSYTDSGNLRFPVEDTLKNRIQAGIFGQYANENASYYFDNELAPLKEKQIEEFKEMDIPYKEYREYRKELSDINKTKADKDSDGKAISGTAAGKKAYKIMNGDYSKKEKERLLEGLSSETYKITTSDLNKLNNNEELYKYYFKLSTKGKSDFINAINNYGFDAETLYEVNTVIKNIEDNYSKLNDNGRNLSKQKKQEIKNVISQYTTTKAQYDYLYYKIYKK